MGTLGSGEKARNTIAPTQYLNNSVKIGFGGQGVNVNFSANFVLVAPPGSSQINVDVSPTPSLSVLKLKPLAVVPLGPADGWTYYTNTHRLTSFDGSVWQVYLTAADLNGGTFPAAFTTLSATGASTLAGTTTTVFQTGNISSSQGDPAVSGTVQTHGVFRMRDGNAVLDGGANGAILWLQATDANNLALNYQLNINPNGGLVNVGAGGITVGGLATLSASASVTGSVTATGAVKGKSLGVNAPFNAGLNPTNIDCSNGTRQYWTFNAANTGITISNAVDGQIYIFKALNTSTTTSFTTGFSTLQIELPSGVNCANSTTSFCNACFFMIWSATAGKMVHIMPPNSTGPGYTPP